MTESLRDRLLFVAREFTAGGAAYLLLDYLRRLNPRYGIDLLVTGPCDEETLLCLPGGVSVFKLGTGRLKSETDALGCLEHFLERRQEAPFQRQYKAVLATSVFPDWSACIALSLTQAQLKFVFLVDEGLALYPKLPPRERNAIECCLLAADLVLPVSQRLWRRMAEECPPLGQRPWRLLRPPIEPAEIRQRSLEPGPNWGPHDGPIVLTVARLSPDKQIMQCLGIHHRLRQEGVNFKWFIVGVGAEEERLRAEILRLNMCDAFILMGRQENVPACMRACDIFALLSSSEGCPTVVMEALIVGCAVIMTDVNGADELIEDGHTGLIVPNDPDAIAKGLKKLLQNRDLRECFRRNIASAPPLADPAKDMAWLVERLEEPVPATVSELPQVSILIPTYNHERYIDRAIASALMQDFPFLEVIVSDDASTDQTGLMARTWLSDPRFHYARNERNLGRVANYRKALTEYAQGEWVLMLDGDDHLIDPGFIRRAHEAIQRHADRPLVFVQAGHRVHYLHRDRSDVDILPPIEGSERLMHGGEYLSFVYDTGFFTHLGALYKRETAIEHGFYTADISSSDMDSLLRLALEGEVLLLNTLAGCWVQHGGNASSNLPLREIAANVRIFRQIARMAVQRGLTSMSQIDTALTRYEASTLAYLFCQTVGKTAKGPFAALRMMAIAISVNPRLLLDRGLVSSCRRLFRKLVRLSWIHRTTALISLMGFGKKKGLAE